MVRENIWGEPSDNSPAPSVSLRSLPFHVRYRSYPGFRPIAPSYATCVSPPSPGPPRPACEVRGVKGVGVGQGRGHQAAARALRGLMGFRCHAMTRPSWSDRGFLDPASASRVVMPYGRPRSAYCE